MKKVVRYLVTLTGVMIAALGFVACMCEACDIRGQAITFGIGIAMITVGAGIAFLASKEEEDVFTR